MKGISNRLNGHLHTVLSLNNNAVLVFIIFVLSVSCIGPGLNNNNIIKLPNNYELWRVNAQDVRIGYKYENDRLSLYDSNGFQIGIEPLIVAYYYDARYVLVKSISQTDYSFYKKNFKVKMYYYFLDTLKKKLSGPFDSEFELFEKSNYHFVCVKFYPPYTAGERKIHFR
jgi:hypothetical protein